MENKPLQPYYLPQVSAPFKFIVDNLKEMNVEWFPVLVTISTLKPLQKSVDMDKVTEIAENMKDDGKSISPVFISNKNHILDGHHRVSGIKYKLGENSKIKAIKINADDKDGASMLKIIQDRWERQNKK